MRSGFLNASPWCLRLGCYARLAVARRLGCLSRTSNAQGACHVYDIPNSLHEIGRSSRPPTCNILRFWRKRRRDFCDVSLVSGICSLRQELSQSRPISELRCSVCSIISDYQTGVSLAHSRPERWRMRLSLKHSHHSCLG